MIVLSLFDGMSCGQIACERAGIKVDKYYASEIDKYAIQVTQKNYPDTIQLGDITKWKDWNIEKPDIILAGSPCQGFSFAGKQLNFEDERSKLFFVFVDILRHYKPKYFLFENVNMKQEWVDIISKHIGYNPVFINSRLVSAQDRKRLYWCNWNIEQPDDKKIKWADISEDGFFAGAMRGRRINDKGRRDDYNTDIKIKQYIESRKDDKTNCLSTVGKDNIASKYRVGRTELSEVEWRYLKRNEMERLQTVPDNYTDCVSVNQALSILGNGWTVDVISHILKAAQDVRQ